MNKLNFIYLFFVFVFISATTSCNKDKDISPNEECSNDIPNLNDGKTHLAWGFGPTVVISQTAVYLRGKFNPQNADEIVFWRVTPDIIHNSQNEDLFCYNLKKDSKRKLTKNVSRFSGCSNEGWIAFERDLQIWRINIDGTREKQLTDFTNDINYSPAIFRDAEKILFKSQRDITNGQMFVMDIEGKNVELMDTSGEASGMILPIISPDGNKVAYVLGSIGLYIYDASTRLYQNIPNTEDCEPTLAWMPDNQYIIWNSSNGMYKTDILTGEREIIRENCLGRFYHPTDVSPDGKYLLADRTDTQKVNENKVKTQAYPVLIDLSNMQETKVRVN